MKLIELWALAAVVLFLKTVTLAMIQGAMRARHKTFVRPEDARTYGNNDPAAREVPIVERAQGALRNDGENVPPFLAIGLAYAMLGCSAAAAPWYFGGFVALRIAHGALMIWPRQPLRTIVYGLGVLITGAMSVHVLAQVLG